CPGTSIRWSGDPRTGPLGPPQRELQPALGARQLEEAVEVVFDVGFAQADCRAYCLVRGPGGEEVEDLDLPTTESDMAHATPSRSTRDVGFGSGHDLSWGRSESERAE